MKCFQISSKIYHLHQISNKKESNRLTENDFIVGSKVSSYISGGFINYYYNSWSYYTCQSVKGVIRSLNIILTLIVITKGNKPAGFLSIEVMSKELWCHSCNSGSQSPQGLWQYLNKASTDIWHRILVWQIPGGQHMMLCQFLGCHKESECALLNKAGKVSYKLK